MFIVVYVAQNTRNQPSSLILARPRSIDDAAGNADDAADGADGASGDAANDADGA